MDAASILVLVLVAGVAALLMWFELNSRKNDARTKRSSSVEVSPDPSQKEKPNKDSERRRAA